MPSLEDILKKTKAKSEQINIVRKPVAIADEDRPYTDAPSEQVAPSSPPLQQNFVNKNSTQSEHKLNTNLTQTECDESELNTNSTQTQHKVNTNLIQSEHNVKQNTKLTQTKHKTHTRIETQHKLNTNSTQSEHISDVIGVQRTILLFIFNECKKSGSYVTEPLKLVNIASHLKVVSGSIKTSILRLCKKNLLKINHFKNGRGGWSVYEIPGAIYEELLHMETKHKLNTN